MEAGTLTQGNGVSNGPGTRTSPPGVGSSAGPGILSLPKERLDQLADRD